MPTRTRTPNVAAAQWSPNGGALGQADLTQPNANLYGGNVFSIAVQRHDVAVDGTRCQKDSRAQEERPRSHDDRPIGPTSVQQGAPEAGRTEQGRRILPHLWCLGRQPDIHRPKAGGSGRLAVVANRRPA